MGPGTKHDSPAAPDREVLAGLVERVTFHSAESGFCVLRIKARGHRDLITIVGHAASISAGEFVQATGVWNNDRTHGLQFKASFLRTTMPTTAEGIEKYLGSGMIRGIGPVYAKKLVKAFGADVFDVIEREADRLREVPGIGPVRVKRIISGWADQKVIREIMLFLHSHGVGTSRSVRIFKTYGADAIQLISENPYRLARDIRGIGFITADAIAARLGIEKTAMVRARAGIAYALAEAMDEGHCGLPRDELLKLAEKLLDIPAALIEDAIALELADGTVIADRLDERDAVFLSGLYRSEQNIATRLLDLAAGAPPWGGIDADYRDPLGGGQDRPDAGREPARRRPAGDLLQAPGDHRRPRRRQDDAGQFDPEDTGGEGLETGAGRAHRPGGQAPDRKHGPGSEDHPPPARNRSRPGRLQAERDAAAGMRPAGGR